MRRLRERNKWSLQDLANFSGINKAYLSEAENGKRTLAPEALSHLENLLENGIAGRVVPCIEVIDGVNRLVLRDPEGKPLDTPPIAHIRWTDASGSSYSIFLGER